MAGEPSSVDDDIRQHLVHLEVERRLAARTLTLYSESLARLQKFAADAGVALREAQVHHVRRWAAQLHAHGLASRSIALTLSAWRGFYRWAGREGLVALNAVEGVRAPKAGKPLPKALSVDQAVALAEQVDTQGDPTLAARDHCMVELLYGCGLRVGEWWGWMRVPVRRLPVGVDAAEALAHVWARPASTAACRWARRWRPCVNGWGCAPHSRGRRTRTLCQPARHTLTRAMCRARLKTRALQAGCRRTCTRHAAAFVCIAPAAIERGFAGRAQSCWARETSRRRRFIRSLFSALGQVYDAAHPRAKKGTAEATQASAWLSARVSPAVNAAKAGLPPRQTPSLSPRLSPVCHPAVHPRRRPGVHSRLATTSTRDRLEPRLRRVDVM